MEVNRTIQPRIRWSDGSDGIELPAGWSPELLRPVTTPDGSRLRTAAALVRSRTASADYHRRRQESPDTEVQWTSRWQRLEV